MPFQEACINGLLGEGSQQTWKMSPEQVVCKARVVRGVSRYWPEDRETSILPLPCRFYPRISILLSFYPTLTPPSTSGICLVLWVLPEPRVATYLKDRWNLNTSTLSFLYSLVCVRQWIDLSLKDEDLRCNFFLQTSERITYKPAATSCCWLAFNPYFRI